jgi:hypothetical protein
VPLHMECAERVCMPYVRPHNVGFGQGGGFDLNLLHTHTLVLELKYIVRVAGTFLERKKSSPRIGTGGGHL